MTREKTCNIKWKEPILSDLPPGWAGKIDPESGQPFYWRTDDPNISTGNAKAQWDKPPVTPKNPVTPKMYQSTNSKHLISNVDMARPRAVSRTTTASI